MKLLKKLSNIFKNRKYQELERKIKDLEERVFEKKKAVDSFYPLPSDFYFYGSYTPKTLEAEINDAHEKIEVLAKKLGVKIEWQGEKDGCWKAKQKPRRKKQKGK